MKCQVCSKKFSFLQWLKTRCCKECNNQLLQMVQEIAEEGFAEWEEINKKIDNDEL